MQKPSPKKSATHGISYDKPAKRDKGRKVVHYNPYSLWDNRSLYRPFNEKTKEKRHDQHKKQQGR